MNKRIFVTIAMVGAVVALAACSKHHAPQNQAMAPAQASAARTPAMPLGTGTPAHLAYVARLHPLNTGVTKTQTSGRAQFNINNGMLTIRIHVTGARPALLTRSTFTAS